MVAGFRKKYYYILGKKILIIDSDVQFLRLVNQFLSESGAQVFTAQGGLDGIRKLFTHQPDLIILDIMLPEKEGIQVCQKLRQFTTKPIIMLSALNHEKLLLQSLEAGADDFLSKPLNPEILLARAMAVLRCSERSNKHQPVLKYDDGYLKINVESHSLLVKDRQVKLTPVEFRLLIYLVSNTGKILSFEEILEHVWGSKCRGNDDYVHVYISHLRRKIEQDTKSPRYILSIHGVGYIFEEQGMHRPLRKL